ncbi:UNVERIFIED_CONTAM: protein FIZZY-RELATED 2 [Sesamum angustifolium]|uniref:Protein FIZZY-RELATED 2 n=1 Tax=Sesamum angustifolium TaxID=2727405 RepID=A0AAW2IJR9_9LAMI
METPSTSTSSTEPKTPASKLLSSSYRRPSSSRTIYSDRFIPSRSSSNFALFNLPNSSANSSSDDSHSAYTNLLKSALFGPDCVGGVNGFQPLTPEKSVSGGRFGSRNSDDWSSMCCAVGLGNCVYLWHASSSKVVKLCDLGIDDSVCSVGWAHRGTHLAVGTS